MSLSDAYRAAYNTQNMQASTIHTQSCMLFNDPKVTDRIKQINREMDEKRRMMAASDAALALRVLREMAEKADTDASRIRAAELLAKAGGVFTEQVEITDKTERNEAEVEQAIAQRLARLGLTSKAG
jgi:phage terminase small subunit